MTNSTAQHSTAQHSTAELFLFILITILITLFFIWWQPQILAGQGYGWDGKIYHKMYDFFINRTLVTENTYPFCKRMGTPFIASLLPFEELKNFLVLNIASGIFCAIFTFMLAKIYYKFLISCALSLPLLIGIFAPIRFSNFYPIYTDPLFMMNCAIGMFFLAQRIFFISAVFFVFSSFAREAGVFIILCILLWGILSKNFSKKEVFYFIFAFFLSISLSFYSKEIFGCSGSILSTVFSWGFSRLSDFTKIERFIAAILMTIAPFLVCMNSNLALNLNKRSIDNNLSNVNIVPLPQIKKLGFLIFILSILMAFFGGSDSTRIFYSTYPLFFVFFAASLTTDILSIFYFSCIVSIINSFPKKIPEPLEYLPNNDISGLFSLFPDYAHISISNSLILFILCARIIYLLLTKNRLKINELLRKYN